MPPSSSLLFLLLLTTTVGQLLKDRSVQCTRDTMDVSLSFFTPFHGSVFTEGAPPGRACRWFGSGRNSLEASIPLRTANISEDCGVVEDEKSGAFIVKLVVSPVDGLLVDGFTALNVRCVYASEDITLTLPAGVDAGVVTGSGGAPLLSMQILDGHGLDGPPLQKAGVGQRLTLDLVLKDTAIYDFYVHTCYAHDGTNSPEASISIIDQFGCAVRLERAIDAPVMVTGPVGGGPKHVFVHMYGFQFTSSQLVYFECQVRPCVHSCEREQCVSPPTSTRANQLTRRKREHEMSPLHLQAVLEITPQKSNSKRSALVSQEETSQKYCLDLPTILLMSALFLATLLITVVVIFFSCRRSSTRKLERSNSNATYSTANLEHIHI